MTVLYLCLNMELTVCEKGIRIDNLFQSFNNNNMFNNNSNDNSPNNKGYEQQESIAIPNASSSSSSQYYERILYQDPLNFMNEDFPIMQQQPNNKEYYDDPMTDQSFLEFLSLLSSSEPTPLPSSSLLLLQGHPPQPEPTTSATHSDQQKTSIKRAHSSTTSNSTRVGQCEHPKHVLYRQEKYTLVPSKLPGETSVLKATPRRGRPPKGTKSSEYLFSTSPVDNLNYYPIVELSVRPLPKRLEPVVGKSNIKVCLTCLKRSDLDEDYLKDKAYVGPQQVYKKKK